MKKQSKLTAQAQALVDLCLALNDSGCSLEDEYWRCLLNAMLQKIAKSRRGNTVSTVLEYLREMGESVAHDILIEQAETASEACQIEHEGIIYDCLLLVLPIAAWTRYSISLSTIHSKLETKLCDALLKYICAEGAKVAILPGIYSIDMLPNHYSDTYSLLQALAKKALGLPCKIYPHNGKEFENPMTADSRMVVAAVCVPHGQRLFRWQEEKGSFYGLRNDIRQAWEEAVYPIFQELLPACGLEILLPDAFYIANRKVDKRIRYVAINAAVQWLEYTYQQPASGFRATVAVCGIEDRQEIRVGFSTRNSQSVLYGSLWPFLGEEIMDPIDDVMISESNHIREITAQLRSNGIEHIIVVDEIIEHDLFIDPSDLVFPNPSGELSPLQITEKDNEPIVRYQ